MPSALHRFLRLPMSDQVATAEALAVVVGTRVAVGALPSSALSRWVNRAMRAGSGQDGEISPDVDRVCGAVRRASLRVPGATCLVQALAGWIMLERRHVRARVEVGVQMPGGGLRAHAWLVVAERVVLGGQDGRARFLALRARDGESRQ